MALLHFKMQLLLLISLVCRLLALYVTGPSATPYHHFLTWSLYLNASFLFKFAPYLIASEQFKSLCALVFWLVCP